MNCITSTLRILILSLTIVFIFPSCNTPQDNNAPTVVFVTGGDEYQSRERMKLFAEVLEVMSI